MWYQLTLGDGSPGVELVPVVVEVDAALGVDVHVAAEAARQSAVGQLPLLVEEVLVVPGRRDDVRHVGVVSTNADLAATTSHAHEHVFVTVTSP